MKNRVNAAVKEEKKDEKHREREREFGEGGGGGSEGKWEEGAEAVARLKHGLYFSFEHGPKKHNHYL